MTRNAYISGTGSFAPDRVVPNSYFNELLGEDVDTWLITNLTIRERRWCSPDESTADLCEEAAHRALVSAGLKPSDLDLIIVSTDTPEYISPSTASVVQDRIGAENAGTFDVNTACAGFVTVLDMAAKYIKADDRYQHILIIGAYAMSKYLDMTDKKTVTLFADGAGAAVVSATTEPGKGYYSSELHSQGKYNSWMGIYAGGAHQPTTHEVIDNKDQLLKFVRKFPKELNPQVWTKMAQDLCERAGIQPKDLNHFFMTQININSIWETLDNLGVPRERAHTIMDRFGYTGSAAIGMALDEAVKMGKVKSGDWCLFIGSGGGLAFAAALFKW
ncbi:MAG: ketoacyl-ACP synthase III [Bacteroidetes bacterium]|nr:ketoacyl-ACP synthase III [Bacteroidota bacterium]